VVGLPPDAARASPSRPTTRSVRGGATTLLAILLGATLRGAHGIGYVLIAKRLVVTNATVKSHLAHTYAKLGVQSRTEVIALARQRGLIS